MTTRYLQNRLPEESITELASGVELEGHIDQSIGKEVLANKLLVSLTKNHPRVEIKTDRYYVGQMVSTSGGNMPPYQGTQSNALQYTGKTVAADTNSGIIGGVNNEPNIPNTDYTFNYEKDNVIKTWELKHDGSIGFYNGKIPVEVTTPKMESENEFQQALRVFSKLEEAGMESAETGGIHLHYDWPNPTNRQKALMVLFYAAIDQKLQTLFSVNPLRKVWVGQKGSNRNNIKIFREALVFNYNLRDIQKVDQLLVDNFDEFHRRQMPFTFSKHGTIEFRIPNSTMNIEDIAVMRRLFYSLVKKMRNDPESFLWLLTKYPDSEIPLIEVFDMIGFDFNRYQDNFSNIQRSALGF